MKIQDQKITRKRYLGFESYLNNILYTFHQTTKPEDVKSIFSPITNGIQFNISQLASHVKFDFKISIQKKTYVGNATIEIPNIAADFVVDFTT